MESGRDEMWWLQTSLHDPGRRLEAESQADAIGVSDGGSHGVLVVKPPANHFSFGDCRE